TLYGRYRRRRPERMIKKLALSILASLALTACDPGCANNVTSAVKSQDGRFKAVIFARDCGATAGFTSQVSVLESDENIPAAGGNAFIADTNHGLATNSSWGGPQVTVMWINPKRLEVRYDRRARIFLKKADV